MKKNHIVCIALLMSFTALLSACGTTKPSEDPRQKGTSGEAPNPLHSPAEAKKEPEQSPKPEASQEPDTARESETSQEPDAYTPAPEEIAAYSDTWMYIDCFSEEERVYRLILSEDGMAQFVIQNGIGELSGLSGGTWSVTGRESLKIDLIPDMADGQQIEESQQKAFGGEYGAYLKTSDRSLSLSCENGASPLTPDHEYEPITFYPESAYSGNDEYETGRLICDAVLRWYEDVNKEPYPGVAEVESMGPEGWEIHLYEDMGGHIATAGRYTVDPVTMLGTDDILGTEIDFSSYCP